MRYDVNIDHSEPEIQIDHRAININTATIKQLKKER